eukprot:15021009-Heterocapsa_arctica.AAC.1
MPADAPGSCSEAGSPSLSAAAARPCAAGGGSMWGGRKSAASGFFIKGPNVSPFALRSALDRKMTLLRFSLT